MIKRLVPLLLLACLGLALLGAVCGPTDDADDATTGPSSLQEPQATPDPDPDDPADDEADNGTPGTGQVRKAEAFATEFGVTTDEVMAQRDAGIGWGALFKLYKLAQAHSVSVDTLIAQATVDANGERSWNFGEMEQALTSDQRAAYDDGPKNLGQLISGSNKPKPKATPTP